MRRRDELRSIGLAQEVGHAPLVRRILIGMEKTDRDRLRAGREIGRSREAFCLVDLTGVSVECQQVRECATDIDGNAYVLQDAVPSSYCAVMLALRAALVKSAISWVRIFDSPSGVVETGSI